MLSFYTFILLIFGLASVLDAKSSSGNSVLVILDPARRPDYSIFFNGLQGGLCDWSLACFRVINSEIQKRVMT